MIDCHFPGQYTDQGVFLFGLHSGTALGRLFFMFQDNSKLREVKAINKLKTVINI